MATTHPSSDWRTDVARARAQATVVHRQVRDSAINAVTQHGAQPIDVALLIGVKQETLLRWVNAAASRPTQGPEALGATAYEIAQRYAAGDISHEAMIDALLGWPYERDTTLDGDYWELTMPALQTGTFGETVGRAFDDGLINGQDYEYLAEHAPEPGV